MNSMRMRKVNRLHFVGIGGVGMAGIAEILLGEGYEISGSDIHDTPLTQRLRMLGAKIYLCHKAEHVIGADVLVRSSAISLDNSELQEAIRLRIPIVQRAAMLAELMRFRYGIAIAGTHGKTTTTSLVASIFAQAGKDPTFVIGGKLNSAQTNARLGKGEYLIAEADESDKSFLLLNPVISVVTNIDTDHLCNYDGSFTKVKEAFVAFIQRLPFHGLAIMCLDDPVVAELLPELSRPTITYGFSKKADVQIDHVVSRGMMSEFTINGYPFQLNLPGAHNVLNATAAYIVAKQVGIDDADINQALTQFAGVGRRFQDRGTVRVADKTVQVIDDYAHHPKEIAATLAAARSVWPDRRIVGIFQPHRYSRTIEQFDDFCRVLSSFDVLLLLDVYAAGESMIEGGDSKTLAKSIRQRNYVDPILVQEIELREILSHIIKDGDILLMMGAGNITHMATALVSDFNTMHKCPE